ncbi:MAG: SPFH/Band 7/PHB domain protein [bacterium]|nr:SPFH/Band 7/PHB domain protein [bacterium]
MIRIARSFLGIVGLALVGFVLFLALFERVPPATIAVKQSLFGGGGINEVDYEMGFHIGITGVHKWHYLDRKTHFLTYAHVHGRSRGRVGDAKPALNIRTKDNNMAFFDLTVTYRIIPGRGFEIVKQGNQHKYRDQADISVQTVMRAELAKLASEEIYSSDTRLGVVERAMPALIREMEVYRLEPIAVLIRAVTFPDQYEDKLKEKQLTYQKRLLALSQTGVEDQQAKTDGLAAEIEASEKELQGDWDKKLQEARSNNEVRIAEILAEAEKYEKATRAEAEADYETFIAEGNLAIAKAEALRNELRNQALDTVGGRIYLARQAAENLQFEHVTLNSNDPAIPSILDIEEMVRLLMGQAP